MAKDAIARRSDVKKDSVELKADPGATGRYQPGTITFAAEDGQSIDLEKMHGSLKATRLGGRTSSRMTFLEITATGEIVAKEQETLLIVSRTGEHFVLIDPPDAKAESKTPLQRLQETVKRGEKVKQVTGRLQGWSGVFPNVLKEVPGELVQQGDKPAVRRTKLVVTDFQTAKE